MKANARILLSIASVFVVLTTTNCSSGGGSSNSTPAATGAYGTSCGNGLIYSQYGCQPQCGVSSVQYQNQCLPITQTGAYGNTGYGNTGYGNTGYGTSQYPGAQICQGSFGPGYVQVQGQPLPQGTCGPCYGQYGANCYIGDYAHQYYGY